MHRVKRTFMITHSEGGSEIVWINMRGMKTMMMRKKRGKEMMETLNTRMEKKGGEFIK